MSPLPTKRPGLFQRPCAFVVPYFLRDTEALDSPGILLDLPFGESANSFRFFDGKAAGPTEIPTVRLTVHAEIID
jgi:hypothetical protein